jgi:hypothetical protein
LESDHFNVIDSMVVSSLNLFAAFCMVLAIAAAEVPLVIGTQPLNASMLIDGCTGDYGFLYSVTNGNTGFIAITAPNGDGVRMVRSTIGKSQAFKASRINHRL